MKVTQEQMKKGEELMETLVKKAWESATFKEQLISNPTKTVNTFFGEEANNLEKVVVEDQTDTSIIYLNIPRKYTLDDFELSEEQLESVSGGIFVIDDLVIVAAILCCGIMVGDCF